MSDLQDNSGYWRCPECNVVIVIDDSHCPDCGEEYNPLAYEMTWLEFCEEVKQLKK
jgi:hypothetical protein